MAMITSMQYIYIEVQKRLSVDIQQYLKYKLYTTVSRKIFGTNIFMVTKVSRHALLIASCRLCEIDILEEEEKCKEGEQNRRKVPVSQRM